MEGAFFFSSRRRHTRSLCDWSSDVCSSDLGWGFAWPANRRIIYNRASADPSGKPWSEKKKLIWWDAEAKKWVGNDVPDFSPTMAPDAPREIGRASCRERWRYGRAPGHQQERHSNRERDS